MMKASQLALGIALTAALAGCSQPATANRETTVAIDHEFVAAYMAHHQGVANAQAMKLIIELGRSIQKDCADNDDTLRFLALNLRANADATVNEALGFATYCPSRLPQWQRDVAAARSQS
jgi:hypothetical protein